MKRQEVVGLLKYMKVFLYLQIAFFSFSTFSVLLPNKKIKAHLEQAVDTYSGEAVYPQYFIREDAHMLDNFTDYLIMDFMYNVSPHKPMKYVLFPQGHLISQTWDGQLQLKNTIENQEMEPNFIYGRYWLGSSYFLRWLFLFFDLSGVRWMLFLIGSLAFAGFVSSIHQNLGSFQLTFFVLGLVFINFYLFFMSFQFAPVFILTFLGAIALNRRLKNNKSMGILFLILGGCTAYFDLLTVPIMTLGIPLLLWIALQKEEIELKRGIISLFRFSVIWTIGYLGTWAFKWLIVTVFTDYSMVDEAFNIVGIHTGLHKLSRSEAILKNIEMMNLSMLSVLFLILALLMLFFFKKKGIRKALLFLSVVVLPFLWEFVTANHVDMHAWFTYRNFWISVTGICLAFGALINVEKLKKFVFYRKNE